MFSEICSPVFIYAGSGCLFFSLWPRIHCEYNVLCGILTLAVPCGICGLGLATDLLTSDGSGASGMLVVTRAQWNSAGTSHQRGHRHHVQNTKYYFRQAFVSLSAR